MCEVLEPGEFYKIKEPERGFADIAGYEEVKERVKEFIVMPLKFPDAFKQAKLKPHRGILLWGPPKTGIQAMIAASAKEIGCRYISANAINLVEDEHAIEHLFSDARKNEPCIVYIADVEILAPRREAESGIIEKPQKIAEPKITRKFFAEIDKLMSENRDIIIAASSHRVDILDPALLRNGRIDRKIFVPAPDFEDRIEIIKHALNGIPLAEEVSIEKLAELTNHYGVSEILSMPREAVVEAVKEFGSKFEKVYLRHFERALKKLKPIGREVIKRYEEIYKEECKHRYMY